MKTPILGAAIFACALASVPVASAQDKTTPAKPAMSMEMEQQMSRMQANMKDMQAQMEKIRATTDPKVRQELMEAHMQAMQECMTTMRGQDKPMTMSGSQGGGMAMGGSKANAGGEMMKHHQMMQSRMGMMESMMEQMLQHMQMMQAVPAK